MLKIELGCGMKPTPGYIHHDRIKHSPHVDTAWDLTLVPWRFELGPNNTIRAYDPKDTVSAFLDEILAIDVFEHIFVDIQPWLDECWRLLKPGGLLDFRVPSWDHELSYRDPTHKRVFHHEAMYYWQPGHPLYEDFGCYYFAESDKWWTVESVVREVGDFRFRMRKLATKDGQDARHPQ
jgi:hypothetical protein